MEEVTVIGIDLAKRSFQLHGATADGSVAHGREPTGKRSHEQPLVQRAGARQPRRTVSGATTLRRTAGYGPVYPVVWGDGGRESPSHPTPDIMAMIRSSPVPGRREVHDGQRTGPQGRGG